MATRNISSSTIKLLFGRSGGLCALYKQEYSRDVQGATSLHARICHIRGLNQGSARHDSK